MMNTRLQFRLTINFDALYSFLEYKLEMNNFLLTLYSLLSKLVLLIYLENCTNKFSFSLQITIVSSLSLRVTICS